jgi:phage terminase small subunit
MPKTGTDLQQRFVVEYVTNGGNATSAAKVAGYSVKTAGQMGFKLMGNPHVQDAIRAEQRRLLNGDMATKALGVLRSIMENEDAPAGARVDAAKTVLDRAGLVAVRTGHDDSPDVPVTQMPVEQLRKIIALGENRISQLQAEIDALAIEGEAQPA